MVLKRSRRKNDFSVYVPDSWSGNTHLMQVCCSPDFEHVISPSKNQFFLSKRCMNIILISSNLFFITGVKYILEQISDFSLKVFRKLEHCNDLTNENNCKIIITVSTKAEILKLYEMLLNGITNRKNIKLLIYSDTSIKGELENLMQFFHGAQIIGLNADIDMLGTLLFSSSSENSIIRQTKKITEHQSEILRMSAKGQSVKAIACQLGIKPGTVYTLKRRALCKAGAYNKALEAIFHMQTF